MRKELELIALIESYLNGSLSGNELKSFELRMETNAKLREEVSLQKETMAALEGVMIRRSVQQAQRLHLRHKMWKWVSIAVVAVVAAAAVWVALSLNHDQTEHGIEDANAELHQEKTSAGFHELEVQRFMVNADEQHVIEGQAGTLVAIPAQAFVDANGQQVHGDVEIQLVEALDPESIVKGRLSTTSNGEELSTGGMFYINAFQEGKELRLAEGKDLMIDLLSEFDTDGMLLFDGVLDENGNINWVDPQPIEQFLSVVPLEELDFYPPYFLSTLADLGFDVNKKALTDSIFYAYTCDMNLEEESDNSELIEVWVEQSDSEEMVWNSDSMSMDTAADEESASEADEKAMAEKHAPVICEMIKPSTIQTIKEAQFQNTFVATREFEERLKLLWLVGEEKYLDIYISNLDKPLWYSDSLLLSKYKGRKFEDEYFTLLKLYNQRDGNVDFDRESYLVLQEFFKEKRELFRASAEKTRKQLEAERQEAILADQLKNQEYLREETKRRLRLYQEEFELNLKEAYRQLGKDWTLRAQSPNPGTTLSTNRMGWKNVDYYTALATQSRTTLDYTAPNGDKAMIKYEPVNVTVDRAANYDEVVVYLLGDPQASFRKMIPQDSVGLYRESLNELISYNLLVIGYKGESRWVYSQESISGGEHKISLRASSVAEVDQLIRQLATSKSAEDIQTDIDYRFFKIERARRDQLRLEKLAEERKIWNSIFTWSEGRQYLITWRNEQ